MSRHVAHKELEMERRIRHPWRRWFYLAMLWALVTFACQVSVGIPGQTAPETSGAGSPASSALSEADEEIVMNAFLKESDLPSGWYRDYFNVKVVEGDLVYVAGFRVTDEPGLDYIFVGQDIILFENEPQAEKRYRESYIKYATANSAVQPKEIRFQSEADEFSVGCNYSNIDIQPENFCGAVGRYGRLVSVLYTKTWDEDDEEQWFTWGDFQRALEAMDRRALEALGQ
jgi:hypothetical protein